MGIYKTQQIEALEIELDNPMMDIDQDFDVVPKVIGSFEWKFAYKKGSFIGAYSTTTEAMNAILGGN